VLRLGATTCPVGKLEFRIKLRDDSNYAIDDVSLPPKFVCGPADDATDVNLPTLAFAGGWSPSLNRFLDIDARIERLAIVGKHLKAGIDAMTCELVSSDKGNDRWDRSRQLTVDGVHIGDDDHRTLSLRQAVVKLDVTGSSLAALSDLNDRMEAAARAQRPLDAATAKRLGEIGALIGVEKSTIRVADFSAGDATGRAIAVRQVTLVGRGADLDRPRSVVSWLVDYDGATFATGSAAYDDLASALAPRRLSLAVAFEDLPTREMFGGTSALGWRLRSIPTTDENRREQVLLDFAQAIREAIWAAHSKLRIDPSRFASTLLEARFEGLAQASAQAALGGVVVLKVDIVGLDAAIAAGKKALGSGEGGDDRIYDVFRLMSERHTASDGTVTDHYDFALSPRGDMTINGKPFHSLFQ
jgi:hypothetical protein